MKTVMTALTLILAGCSTADPAGRTANTSGENVAIAVDAASGNVAVALPGFAGNIKVPTTMVSSANFDIDGVKLYPGSKIGAMNVTASDGKGEVRVDFTSPANIAAVRADLVAKFGDKSIAVTGDANTLSGETAKGDRFTIALSPQGANATHGIATIVDMKK